MSSKKVKEEKVLFFELRGNSLLRFPLWIAKAFLKNRNVEFIFWSEEKISNDVKEKINSELNTNSKFIVSGFPAISTYKNKLNVLEPDLVIVFAHRLPDMTILNAANQLGIQTVYYQHGLYIPFMKRELGLFFKNIKKSIRYALHALALGLNSTSNVLIGFISFLRIFIYGKKQISNYEFLKSNLASQCLVYGEHWVNYHISEYGYDKKNITIVGTPDLQGINIKNVIPGLPSNNKIICYVAQTLVEDGRLNRALMVSFLSSLSEAIQMTGGELQIKLHPRSDLSLYESMKCNFNYSNEFPQARVYIGHYSTILIRGIAYTDKYILIDFPDHKIPDYIQMLAIKTLNYDDRLKINETIETILNSELDQKSWIEKIEQINYYFDANDDDPFDRAVKKMEDFDICP